MSNDDFDFRDKIAAINAEFDQFRAAMAEVTTTVCDYRQNLRKSRQFSKEEQFMLTMGFQELVLGAILHGNLGSNPDDPPQVPDFPPDE